MRLQTRRAKKIELQAEGFRPACRSDVEGSHLSLELVVEDSNILIRVELVSVSAYQQTDTTLVLFVCILGGGRCAERGSSVLCITS